jgi:hypothetical protein
MAGSRFFRGIVFLCGLGYIAAFAAGVAAAQAPRASSDRQQRQWNDDRSDEFRLSSKSVEEKEVPAEHVKKKKDEINCAVVKWEPDLPDPALTLVCPPEHVFTPVRVFLKVAGPKSQEIPKDLQRIVAAPHSPARIRPTPEALYVRLRVNDTGEETGKEAWIAFSSVLAFSLQGE